MTEIERQLAVNQQALADAQKAYIDVLKERDELKAKLEVANVENALSSNFGKDYHKDNPECDGTDNAHPAWLRGNDAGAIGMAYQFEKVIDGGNAGAIAQPDINRTMQKLVAMKNKIKVLVEALETAKGFEAWDSEAQCAYPFSQSAAYQKALAAVNNL